MLCFYDIVLFSNTFCSWEALHLKTFDSNGEKKYTGRGFDLKNQIGLDWTIKWRSVKWWVAFKSCLCVIDGEK